MKSDREEQKVEISPFDMICDAALSNDPDLLSNALKIVCIDVWQESDYGTPVTRLAYLGKVDAVKFLLDRGASPANAACGYARGDHMKELYELLSQVKKQNPNKLTAVLKQATYGVALNQDAKKLDAFWKKITEEYPDQIELLYGSLAKAHAQKGNMDEVDKLCKSIRYKSLEMATEIISGLALGGHVEKINSFYKPHLKSIIDTVHKKIMVIYLAQGGHKDKIRLLEHTLSSNPDELIMQSLAQNGIDENTERHDKSKACGFAAGGYREKAFEYAARKIPYLNLQIAAEFTDAGHFDAAFDLLKTDPDQNNTIAVADAFCDIKNPGDANVFLEKMKKDKDITPEQITTFIKNLISGFCADQRFSEALYFFEKEPTEAMLLSVLAKHNTPQITEALKIILMRHESFAKIILERHLLCNENPNLSLIVHAAVLYPEMVQSLAEPLKKSGCDLEKLTPKITRVNEDIARLGFTTMRQLVAWRDPVIRYLLISKYFREKIPSVIIGNIVNFLSPAPVSKMEKNRLHFFEKMHRPAPPISDIAPAHAPEESKITISVVAQKDLKNIIKKHGPSRLFGGERSAAITALDNLISNPELKGTLIDRTVIENILSPYPEEYNLFTNMTAQAGDSNTDKVIVAIRELYGSKNLANESKRPDSRPEQGF